LHCWRGNINKNIKTTSIISVLLGWLLFSVLNIFITWQIRDRARLIRDNDNERSLSTLFAGLRNYEDFDSAVESDPALKGRINGLAVYDANLNAVYRWGKVSTVFDEQMLEGVEPGRFGRYTIPDRRRQSAKFVIRFGRMNQPPVPPPPAGQNGIAGNQQHHQERRIMEARQNMERYFYVDITHPEYWHTLTLTTILFPFTEIAVLILLLYIRRLYLRNREYREKIEAQHNLVVLGTAAGTLAHEIKNPLLSIRLQTGILEKISGEKGKDELAIINQEVDRLSALVYRVNDYLRDPAGEKTPLNIADLLAETVRRICGVNAKSAIESDAASLRIFADENRVRSVLENILRNALESGSPSAEVGASLAVAHNSLGAQSRDAVIRIFDRGRGIPEKDLKRVFDPFFTSKSAGTGIGLAVSKRFTEAAGGTIKLENRADNNAGEAGGLMVTLTFPEYIGSKTA
jgi:two-component system sensor histidine kinase HydH